MLGDGYLLGSYKVIAENRRKRFYLIELAMNDDDWVMRDDLERSCSSSPEKPKAAKKITPQTTAVSPPRPARRTLRKRRQVVQVSNDDDDFSEADKHEQKHNPPDDEDSEENPTLISSEEDACAFLGCVPDSRDRLEYKEPKRHVENEERELVFYTTNGDEIDVHKDCFVASDIEFLVCTGAYAEGVVMSREHPNLIVCGYTEDEGTFSVAPGCVSAFDPPDVSSPEWSVRYAWLVPNADYNPHVHTNIQTATSDSEISSLPVSAILASTRLLPRSAKERLMPNYSGSLRVLETANTMCDETGGSARRRRAAGLFAKGSMHDYLELYHVRYRWIWRTALGEHIMKNFIEPFEQFGNAKEQIGKAQTLRMISEVMCNTTFDAKDVEREKGICDACKLPRVLGSMITFERDKDLFYFVGCDCREKLHYLHKIGRLIRNFRTTSSFNLTIAKNLLPNMGNAQEFYLRQVSQRNFQASND
jgi:hypothetical protein